MRQRHVRGDGQRQEGKSPDEEDVEASLPVLGQSGYQRIAQRNAPHRDQDQPPVQPGKRGPSPRVRSLFELTRLEEIIEVHDSVAAAVAAPFRAADDPLGELGGSALDAGESTTIGEASERHG